jgi:hypothetical protein
MGDQRRLDDTRAFQLDLIFADTFEQAAALAEQNRRELKNEFIRPSTIAAQHWRP